MSNQIQVIAPYWLHGTWVFDDPRTGLVQEPFVSSVPEMIDDLVSGIPNARHGIPSLVLIGTVSGLSATIGVGSSRDGGELVQSRSATD